MNIVVSGKNVEITGALRDYVTKKINKLSKYFEDKPITARAVLSVEKDRQIVEVTIPVDGMILRGEEATFDMYASIDMVIDKLDKQFTRFKSRSKRRTQASLGTMPIIDSSALPTTPEHPHLVRRKTFPLKPMMLDEALLQMDLLGHDFFAFNNADTDSVNVLYRRRDGQYGLLEPR